MPVEQNSISDCVNMLKIYIKESYIILITQVKIRIYRINKNTFSHIYIQYWQLSLLPLLTIIIHHHSCHSDIPELSHIICCKPNIVNILF